MRRREFATTAIALVGAGCVMPATSDTETNNDEKANKHHITVLNSDEKPHSFVISVENSSSDEIFRRDYELSANTGDENRVINGEPAFVEVVIDGEYEKEFEWNPNFTDFSKRYPDGCDGKRQVSLTIEVTDDDLAGEYSDDSGDFQRSFGCSTA